MTTPPVIRLSLVLTGFTLLACEPNQIETPADTATIVDELARPDPATMDADVAALIEEHWAELEAVRTATDVTPTALADAYARFGLACFGNGLVIPAEAAFVKATQQAPGDARWLYFLALIREFTGELEASAQGFEAVLALREDDLPALIRLGDVRLEQAQIDAARAAYERAVNLDPDSAAAEYGLGRVASEMGNDALAVEHFARALDLQPHADRLNYVLGLSWRNLGDLEKAQRFLAKRGEIEPSFADPLFDEISGGKARIGGLWANMNAGSQAYVDGDYARAASEFEIATQDHPEDSRSWQSLGMALAKLGDLDGAVEAYERSLGISEQNAFVRHNIAELLIQRGDFSSAETHLEKAVEVDPWKVDSHELLAQVLTRRGDLNAALARYDAALERDPQSVSLAISRAQTLVSLDRSDEALAALATMADENPLAATARLAYGMMLLEARRLDDAKNEIEQALTVAANDSEKARAQFALGRLHLSRTEAAAAVSAFESALELDPDHRAASLALARTHGRARRYEDALATYDTHLQRMPNDDTARIEAATAAILLQRPGEVKRVLEAGMGASASPRLLSAYARFLALAADMEIRDPERALGLAERSYEQSGSAKHAETVALCLAATGRFAEAVDLQQQLVEEVAPRVDARSRARMEENLRRYRSGSYGRLPLDG